MANGGYGAMVPGFQNLWGLAPPAGMGVPASDIFLPYPNTPALGTKIFGGQFGQPGGPGGVRGLFEDRNFLSMLAGMGGRFGRGESAGEALGAPAMRTLAALSSQEALQGAEAKREAFNQQLLKILAGLTPQEQEGFTDAKITNKGLTLNYTPPGAVDEYEYMFTDPRTGGAGAGAGTAPTTPTPVIEPIPANRGGTPTFRGTPVGPASPIPSGFGEPPVAPGEGFGAPPAVGAPDVSGAAPRTAPGRGREFAFSDIFPFS